LTTLPTPSAVFHLIKHIPKIADGNYWFHHVCLSVHPCGTAQFQWTDFHEILYLRILKNMSRKFSFH